MRTLLLYFILIITTLTLRIHQQEPQHIRLRRSIHTLNET